jgi:putative membrane protein
MLWLKSFHIIAMVCWFAGLFYLPRLFVYHCEILPEETKHYKQFCTMERRLFWGIMTPSAIFTIFLGLGLLHSLGHEYMQQAKWIHYKLLLVFILIGYHIHCGITIKRFKLNINKRSAKFYRYFNEFPVIILIATTLLVVLKPF